MRMHFYGSIPDAVEPGNMSAPGLRCTPTFFDSARLSNSSKGTLFCFPRSDRGGARWRGSLDTTLPELVGSRPFPSQTAGSARPAIASSRIPLRRQTNPVAATARAFVRRVFANSPITSRLAVNRTRATIGIGRTRLKTTWLSTRARVTSTPAVTTAKEAPSRQDGATTAGYVMKQSLA